MERKVRKYKRYVEGCADPRNVKFYKEKLNEAGTELSTLIKENSDILKYDKDRVKHYYGGTPKESLDNYNPRDIIEDEIRKGSVFLEINHEKQARHLLGDGYIEGRSYFTVSEDALAQILKEKYGTGELKFDDKTGKWKRKEIIEVLYDIGICIDKNGNKELTNRITIHYSSTGVHLVPAKKVRKSND
ncbi:MAG: hypothetical protein IJO99_03825 [Ruminococcus sp.]|nr:hypothetical protein [Ruminococcus sp.]